MPKSPMPKKGSDINLEIESLAFGGMGVAKYNGIVVFVKNSIPGQKITARIIKKKGGYLEARPLEVLLKSEDEIVHQCEHFIHCGGCSFQNMDYNKQLIQKEKQVKDLFVRIGNFNNIKINSIVGCNDIYNYRNKMEFTFGNHEWIPEGKSEKNINCFALGLHVPKRFDKILNINNCEIQSQLANKIFNKINYICKKENLIPYDVRMHKGFLKFLIIRKSYYTDDVMVNLVTSYKDIDALSPIANQIKKEFPNVKSFINSITSKKSGVSTAEEQYVLFGENSIYEKLNNFKFKISSESFFQPNTKQAEELYKLIKVQADLKKDDVVYDLFCGTGTIGLYLSKFCKSVYGFDIIVSAINDAIINAKINHIKNSTFICGDLMNLFETNTETKHIEEPNVVILDPPRAGLHSNTISAIINKSPKKIIYISCNPSTQARDVKILCENGYRLQSISPIDMFPHTPHIENIANLILV